MERTDIPTGVDMVTLNRGKISISQQYYKRLLNMYTGIQTRTCGNLYLKMLN